MSTKRTKSTALRNQAVGMCRSGLSLRAAAEELGCSFTFVRNAMKKEERGEGLEDAPRCGRPPKLNSREVRSLVKNLNQDRSQSSAELLSTSFGTSKQLTSRSIRNYLAKRGFRKCRAGKTPLLNSLQQLRRYRWAHLHKHYNFKKMVFSDEKRFAKRPDGVACDGVASCG